MLCLRLLADWELQVLHRRTISKESLINKILSFIGITKEIIGLFSSEALANFK